MRCGLIVALLLAIVSSALGADSQAVSVNTGDQTIVVNNGLVEIAVSRHTGQIVSLADVSGAKPHQLGAPGTSMYWDANVDALDLPAGATPPKKGYFRPAPADDLAKVVHSDADRAEIAVTAQPNQFFQFNVEFHFAVLRGQSGVYAYVIVSHTKDLAAARFVQTRFVVKTVTDGTFDYWSIGPDAFVKIPTATIVAKVTDATFRLADGTVKTKYLNSVYWAKTPVYGVLGPADSKARGLWMIEASPEYHNGGPVKQGQTVHDNVLLRVLQSQHFGASPLEFSNGEPWQKIYGPFLLYLNHGADAKELWADATARQKQEAAAWPYQWVQSPQYIKQRGTVTGQLNLENGSATGAWVILAQPGSPWTAQGKDYIFWSTVDAQGKFTIPKIIPGKYTLYASGGDQPEDFSHDNVEIKADETTDLGTLNWKPITHGQKIWQIGTFDRSAGEFRNGEDARQYQMFTLYPKQFPNDVIFTAGKSDIKKDWNYAQWSWYAKDPQWRIHFDMKDVPTGAATLTLGFASAQPAHGHTTDLRIAVNGTQVTAIHLPKTGTAGYRGGVQDSPYNISDITFDTKLLHPGTNEITLAHADAELFHAIPEVPQDDSDDAPPSGTGYPGQVMYDALRLEIAPAASTQTTSAPAITDPRFTIGKLINSDDFSSDAGNWKSELETGGSVTIDHGRMDIDVPGGATVWFKPQLQGPLLIEYQATVISAGGPNDRVSDLNCFWMAHDSRNSDDIFAVQRTGKFSDYNQLLTYYVGLGGNGNTTTRFRRYIGDPVVRPLLPEHDLSGSENMITPNKSQTIDLVANNNLVQYYRDGKKIFEFNDPHPYTSGWFGFRTTKNHVQFQSFRVYQLLSKP